MILAHASLTVFVFHGVLVRTGARYICLVTRSTAAGGPQLQGRCCKVVARRPQLQGRCGRAAAGRLLRLALRGAEGRYGRAAAVGSLREGSCCMAAAVWPRAAGCRAEVCKAAGSRLGGCGL